MTKLSSPWQQSWLCSACLWLAAVVITDTIAMICNGGVVKWILKRNFIVSSSKDEQEKGCYSSSVKRHCCNFADRLWEKSHISNLRSSKRNANNANFVVLIVLSLSRNMKESIDEMDSFHQSFERRLVSVCWLEKQNTSFFSKDGGRRYGCKIWSNYRMLGHFGPPLLHVLKSFEEQSIAVPKHIYIEQRFSVKLFCHAHCSCS